MAVLLIGPLVVQGDGVAAHGPHAQVHAGAVPHRAVHSAAGVGGVVGGGVGSVGVLQHGCETRYEEQCQQTYEEVCDKNEHCSEIIEHHCNDEVNEICIEVSDTVCDTNSKEVCVQSTDIECQTVADVVTDTECFEQKRRYKIKIFINLMHLNISYLEQKQEVKSNLNQSNQSLHSE